MYKNYGDYTKCPFNPNHIILKTSLQRHILRCMVQYPNHVVCPHDAQHRFLNNQQLNQHLKDNCPSKRLFEIAIKEPIRHDYFDSRKFHFNEENWENEYN